MPYSHPHFDVIAPVKSSVRGLNYIQGNYHKKSLTMPADNEEFLSKIDERFSKDRNGFFLEYIADDIIWNIAGAGTISGKKNFLEEMKRQELEYYPVITIKNVIIEGEFIIVESTGKTYYKAGKPYEPAYCDIYRLEDGKIRELTTYIVNTAKLE